MHGDKENIEALQGLKPGLDEGTARRVLLKHKGDLQAAASALIEGDTGDDPEPQQNWTTNFTANTQANVNVSRANTPNSPQLFQPPKDTDVIDLTGDDDELSRALQMSLEQVQTGTTFGPSNRAPDPNWALVPSNIPTETGMSHDDHSLSRAIEASLSASIAENTYEDLPPDQRVRHDGRPLALRSTSASLCYASTLLQTLFFIPQIRERIARWRPSAWQNATGDAGRVLAAPMPGEPESCSWHLLEFFTYMDLAQLSYLNADPMLIGLNALPVTSAMDAPGNLSESLYTEIARNTEGVLWEQTPPNERRRLFHFLYAPLREDGGAAATAADATAAPDFTLDRACVRIDVRGTPETADLAACLAAQLARYDVGAQGAPAPQQQRAIVAPSDVVAFHLVRHAPPAPPVGPLTEAAAAQGPVPPAPAPFRYPRVVFLDPFLAENAALAASKRAAQRELRAQVHALAARREALTWFNGKDTLRDLRSAVHYYEHVAKKDGVSAERAAAIGDAALRLRKILVKIENELEAIQSQTSRLQALADAVFNDPALQQHRYDLRAVLVHDGLYGRNHLYSYVHDAGAWWKTLDHSVAEVAEETVLTDATGLHLNAGPYMLIYSRALVPRDASAPRATWPETVRDAVKVDNILFFNGLSADVANRARARYPLSPPRAAVPLPVAPVADDAGEGQDTSQADAMDLSTGP